MFRFAQKNHVCQIPSLIGKNNQFCTQNLFTTPPSIMRKGVSMYIHFHLDEIEWNIQIWTLRLCSPNLNPLGAKRQQLIYKDIICKQLNDISRYAQGRHICQPPPHVGRGVIEKGQYTKIICLLGTEWYIQISTQTSCSPISTCKQGVGKNQFIKGFVPGTTYNISLIPIINAPIKKYYPQV